MVTRVDQVLKSDFNRPDGLADESVFVLDPCCGTGAFLVETLSSIEATLREKGDDALLAEQLKKAATDRIFGFEILPAPFVVAHLQLGLFLQKHGSSFNERKKERAAVYLTNALTGWKPPIGAKQKLLFPEMEEERDAADRIKQKVPILVVLGNPPYNGYAGIPVEEEKGLVEPYRNTKAAPKPQGQGLNDLYIRFFRLAERCITERHAQHGIVCYISNYSWLDGLSHTGLRERFAEEFDQIWIDNLNGDKYKTGKVTPEGKPDPSVFSTPQNREGIQVGTAVALMARIPKHQGPADIRFRDFWGESKREDLLASGVKFQPKKYSKVKPVTELGVAFRPMETEANYTSWPLLTELFPESFPGVKTSRDEGVVDIERDALVKRMKHYFDKSISDIEMSEVSSNLMMDTTIYDASKTRSKLLKIGFTEDQVHRFVYRPFDNRWLYWSADGLLDRPRLEYRPHLSDKNLWLVAVQQNRKQFDPPIVCEEMSSLHTIERGANLFPMLLHNWKSSDTMFSDEAANERKLGDNYANLTDAALTYLNELKGVSDTPHLFHHIIAILHAPKYAAENGSALRQDWPRIPLPAERKTLLASAELGHQVAALLDPETPVDTVTAGKLRPELKVIGSATRTSGGQFTGNDFAITARWGITGQGGITMPAKGKAEPRQYNEAEKTALGKSVDLLGSDTLDIYLNDNAYWKNIPRAVWEYTLGGYQVLKKWLSYREESILGRPLNVDEVAYFTQVARRIAALLLLGPELDKNYQAVKAKTFEWK